MKKLNKTNAAKIAANLRGKLSKFSNSYNVNAEFTDDVKFSEITVLLTAHDNVITNVALGTVDEYLKVEVLKYYDALYTSYHISYSQFENRLTVYFQFHHLKK